MIQAIRETNFEAFIETKANEIGQQTVGRTRHLVKFINDLDGSVFYAYPLLSNIYDRYTQMPFVYNINPDVFTGKLNLIPAGYYKYEVYEVSWASDDVVLASPTAPVTETDVLPVSDANGVVEGLVAIGILYLGEKAGDEEVQYIQNAKRVQALTIQYAGSDYVTAPTVTIAAPGTTGGKQATATCTIDGSGLVNTVTITYAGSGYTENPIVTLTGGGFAAAATITASIEQSNYIYYGQ
jgi:hypothetical protein